MFFPDRVELCGVTICHGERSKTKRKILDLLSYVQSDGRFAAYSGEDLAKELESDGNKGTVAGAIRDLRDGIAEALWNTKNIIDVRDNVILSAGPGYRFAECITVRIDGEEVTEEQSDISDMDDVTNVTNDDTSDSTSSAEERSRWILEQLRSKIRLKRANIAKHFSCAKRTAQRDLNSLKDNGEIEFVGAPRTGNYRLSTPSADSP